MKLTIRLSSGDRWETTLEGDETSTTVASLKQHVLDTSASSQAYLEGFSAISDLRIIFKGRILSENDRTLADYGVKDGDTVFLVKQQARTPASSATSTPTANPTSNTSSSSSPSPFGASGASPFGGSGASPFGGAGGGNNPLGALNNPMLQSFLQNQSPESMRTMMESAFQNNPMLQQMAENNPQIRHFLQDPQAMQQMLDMMRHDPQQLQRMQDLQLSQLDMQGGMGMMSNLYNQLQDPLEQAMEGNRGSSTSSSTTGTATSNAGATGQAMPNPWAAPSPGNRSTNTAGNPMAQMFGGGGGGMPDMSNLMGGGMPTPQQQEQVLNMLENNPAMSQMMQQTVQQNPQLIRNMLIQQNPALQNLGTEALDNMIQQMLRPETMRSMLQMQTAMRNAGIDMQGLMNGLPATGGGGIGAGGLDFNSLLGGGGMNTGAAPAMPPLMNPWANAAPVASAAPAQTDAERYTPQLRSLYNMGFDDEQRNIQILRQVHGNVNRAVDELLSSPPPAPSEPAAPVAAEAAPASTETNPDPPSAPKDATEKKND